eukprot:GHUV01015442.1.p2 GENE.GHUV01015442.1~~GHUV01015442.1.p2  ORF type:complete len:201 (+),score=33.03 GHUV01015442.1:679-1281(+)
MLLLSRAPYPSWLSISCAALFCLLLCCSRPRGFGFIEYKDSRDAEDALYHLDRSTFMGREISVVLSKESRKTPRDMIHRERVYTGGRGGGHRGGGGYGGRERYRDRSPRRYSRSRSRSPRGRRERSYSRSRSPVHRRSSRSRSRSRTPPPRDASPAGERRRSPEAVAHDDDYNRRPRDDDYDRRPRDDDDRREAPQGDDY